MSYARTTGVESIPATRCSLRARGETLSVLSISSQTLRYACCSFACRFIREAEDDAPGGWEVEVARKYYKKLFREYCIADLGRYKVLHCSPSSLRPESSVQARCSAS